MTKHQTSPNPDARREAERILGVDGLAQVENPIEELSGLPNAAYWSRDWLALEERRIFQRSWVFACADGELDEPGAMLPRELGGQPILLVRDEGGAVRGFHNVCRHRGTQLVDCPAKGRRITCPYHAWVYDLVGTLRSRPHFHGPGQLERFETGGGPDLDLMPVRTAHWNGCHFVNISGDAPDLADWLHPMLNRLAQFDFSPIRWIGKRSYRIRANWKLVLENYMEGYHVFAAHPRLLAHAPMDVRWSGEWIEHVFYNDYLAPKLTAGRGDALPHYPGLSDEETRRGAWFALLPNFAVELFADQFVVMATWPLAPDETLEELHFFVIGDAAATEPRFGPARDALIEMWDELNSEDVALLERLQQGRRSEAFRGSRMSPAWEGPAHALSRKIVEAIVAPS